MSGAKRRIALELALRLIATADTPVCLVGADPTDRDVERRITELARSDEHHRMQVRDRSRTLDVLMLPARRLCAVAVPDAAAIDSIMPELRATFRYVIIDAPSLVGVGIGIAPRLPRHLDLLVVASCLTADELAGTRLYLDRLDKLPATKHLEVRVVSAGDPTDGGLAPAQIQRRLDALPTLARVPRLWGRGTTVPDPRPEDVDRAFEPIVRWVVRRDPRATTASTRAPGRIGSHLANALYRGAGAPLKSL